MDLVKLKTINLSILCMLINLNLISMEREQKYKSAKNIKQYEVINNGDKSFSGYHALYNNFMLFKSRKNKSLKKLLTTNENRDRFFGSREAQWQNCVIENRIKILAGFYIEDCLINNLKYIDIVQESSGDDCYKFNLNNNYVKIKVPNGDPQTATQYCQKTKSFITIMPDVVKAIVNKYYEEDTQENKATFKIKFSMLRDCFSRELQNRRLAIPTPMFADIFKQANFGLEFDIVSDCQIKDTVRQKLYNINWHAESNQDFAKLENIVDLDNTAVINPGHWLTGKDLEHLIELEKDKGTDIPEDAPIFCLDKDIKKFFKLEHLKKLANEFMDINYSGSAMFLIYIKEKKHWISCFVIKDSDEASRFIFTDSLNVDRTRTDLVLTLISLLSSHVLDISNIEIPPLELLLSSKTSYTEIIEANDVKAIKIDHVKTIIETLKDEISRKNILYGLLLYGAPKTGKFSLAYTIAKMANWKFLYVDAARVIGDLTLFNKTEGVPAITKEELKNKSNAICSLFINNIRGQLPMVVFVHGIDQIIKDADSDESKKNMLNFMSDILIDLKSRYNYFVYIICTSYLTPNDYSSSNRLTRLASSLLSREKLPIGSKFLEFVDAFELDLPDWDKRGEIINYYVNKLLSDVVKENYDIKALSSYNNILNTASDGFSCSDIKEFITFARSLIKSGDKNIEQVGFGLWVRNSLCDEHVPTLAIIGNLYNYMKDYDEYRILLYTNCKLQAERVQNRKNYSPTFSNSNSSIFDNTVSLTEYYLMSNDNPVMFIITTLGKIIVYADKISEKSHEKLEERGPSKAKNNTEGKKT